MPDRPNNIIDAESPLRARRDAGCRDAAAAAAAPAAPPQRPVPPHTAWETILRILQNEENRSEPLATVKPCGIYNGQHWFVRKLIYVFKDASKRLLAYKIVKA